MSVAPPNDPDAAAPDQPSAEAPEDASGRPVSPAARRGRWIVRVVGLGLAVVLLTYIALGAWAVLGLRRYPGWVSGTEAAAGAPMNILLIGTDAAGGQPGRADTLVIAHLPADRSAIYLVSVPRSTQAALRQGVVQLKTARLIGGVPLTVQAVEQVTGVTIDHVVETDFEGLAALADAVGGVTVTNPQASIADGELPMPAGTLDLRGPTALAFVRDHSVTDDVRNERQRAVLRAVLAKLPPALANPIALARLAAGFTPHIGTDDGLLAGGPDVIARALAGRDHLVAIEAPLLPRAHPWDRAQIDPARMAELVNAMRTGQLGSYRPDHP